MNLVLATRRAPRTVDRAPARLVAAVRGCGCGGRPIAAAVLKAVGVAPLGDTAAWDPATWRAHLQSEEDGFFAKLRALGDPAADAAVDALLADHAAIRAQLDAQEPLDTVMIQKHAQAEDDLAIKYRAALVPQVGALSLLVSDEYLASVAKDAPAGGGSGPSAGGMLAIAAGVVGGALLGGWPLALGGALLGTGVAYTVLAPGAPTPAAKRPFGDPQTYFAEVAAQADEVKALLATRAAESDARAEKWKKAAKQIPVIGDFAGVFVDLGAWLGKTLGSNYAEENSPEDIAHASDTIVAVLRQGFIPPLPQFTGKHGANSYALTLDNWLRLVTYRSDMTPADKLSAQALTAMGNLTILHAGCPAVSKAIADVGNGPGSLGGVGWFDVDHTGKPRLVGFESVVAAIAACEFGVPVDAAFAYTRRVTDHAKDHPIQPGLATDWRANAFTETMRAAAHGEIR